MYGASLPFLYSELSDPTKALYHDPGRSVDPAPLATTSPPLYVVFTNVGAL